MIPKPLLAEILKDKFYKRCVRWREGTCKGRVTFEHAWIYAGKQIQEKWAIIPCCAFHHEVDLYQDNGDLNKQLNQFYALRRATEVELEKYPKAPWVQRWSYLSGKFKEIHEATPKEDT